MKNQSILLDMLEVYSNSDYYPFHMPGHKRFDFGNDLSKLFSIDITEIHGFDNLHHPEGILKDCMERAAKIYGSDKTYFLVNGSTCGILSAISTTTNYKGKILLARNSHKSAYHGAFLNHLSINYIYPQYLSEFGIQCGLLLSDIEDNLNDNPDIQSVFVVSPTYEGIVSDIGAIAKCVHRYGIPLIVDEAHGAHFTFGEGFPKSALALGADIVIQSVHKTLPSLTQTAILHVKEEFVDTDRLEWFLQIYQSSSPSYLLMASIDQCITIMDKLGGSLYKEYNKNINYVMDQLKKLKKLHIMDDNIIGGFGIYDRDKSKIVISTKGASISGATLAQYLRNEFHLEMEMSGADYVLALTTVSDTRAGLQKLVDALIEIDMRIEIIEENRRNISEYYREKEVKLNQSLTIFEACSRNNKPIRLVDCVGCVSAEFIYVYPPGIPIIVPGELITSEVVALVLKYQKLGLSIQGMQDSKGEFIKVIDIN